MIYTVVLVSGVQQSDSVTCARVLSCFSHVLLFGTLRTTACLDPLSMGFSRHEYWSGLPCCPLGDLPDSGIEPMSLVSPILASRIFFTTSTTWETLRYIYISFCKFFFDLGYYRILSRVLCYKVGPCWLSILNIVLALSFCLCL